VILAVVIIVIMPIVPALSAESAMRREFVVAPLFAMFAGIGASELIAMSARRSARLGAAMTAAVAIWIALIGYGEVRGFDLTIRSETARWTLGPEVVETARFLDTLPPESAVYFYSARWPLHHEVIEFLAPDVHGETRGQEYGSTSLAITGGDRDVVFVLLGDYQNLISTLAQKYPGGRTIEGPRVHGVDARPSYVAYAARAGD
jgi:hypothetical protein